MEKGRVVIMAAGTGNPYFVPLITNRRFKGSGNRSGSNINGQAGGRCL
jgi:hypothetical protein